MVEVSCPNRPLCAVAGALVDLTTACSAAGGVTPVFTVNGEEVNTTHCPPAGGTLAVSVRPTLPTKPQCNYSVAPAFDLVCEQPRRAPGCRCLWGLGCMLS